MKQYFSFLILASIILCSNNFLFSGNHYSSDKKENFMIKRFARKFNLEEICKKHSKQALELYKIAFDDLPEVAAKIPKELYEKVIETRDHSFLKLNNITLLQKTAYSVATMNLQNLNKGQRAIVLLLRRIAYYAKSHKWYDPKLAQFLINSLFFPEYKFSQKKLDRNLCTASHLGDSFAVSLLLRKGANYDFETRYNYKYTPLAYALIQEHKYSKMRQKPLYVNFLIQNYEEIAKMLIGAGANIVHSIKNGIDRNTSNYAFTFMLTSNINIFNLFEEQIADKVELKDDLGRNIVVYAFMHGNAKFIKKLYANPLYRDSHVARTDKHGNPRTFMDLAIEYYKGYDFEELYEFLTKNDERPTEEQYTIQEFALQCLDNALDDLDFESIKSLYLRGISLKTRYQSDNSTYLIYCIKMRLSRTDTKNLVKIIELFMIAGLDFDHKDNYGKAALDYAKEQELDEDIIQAIIMTPLSYYLRNNMLNQEELLLLIYKILNENDPMIFNYRDSEGKNALDYAQEFNRHESIIEALMACTGKNFE